MQSHFLTLAGLQFREVRGGHEQFIDNRTRCQVHPIFLDSTKLSGEGGNHVGTVTDTKRL